MKIKIYVGVGVLFSLFVLFCLFYMKKERNAEQLVNDKPQDSTLTQGNGNAIFTCRKPNNSPKQTVDTYIQQNGIFQEIQSNEINIDIFKMFVSVCANNDIAFYYNWKYKNHNYLFCFKKFYSPVELVKFKKNEEEVTKYFKGEVSEVVKDYNNKDFYYFLHREVDFIGFLDRMIPRARNLANSFLFHTPLSMIFRFPNRNILKGVRTDDQRLGAIFHSFLVLTMEKIYNYNVNEKNSFYERTIIYNIYMAARGSKEAYTNDDSIEKANLFLQYVYKEIELPIIEVTEFYENQKNNVMEDPVLAFYNDIAVCFDGFIYDIPFSSIEHIFNSFYVVAFNNKK
ncbi:hypothetical protein NGRA_2659 [Nosema granulosis]|uniref:Uncharacterized protein n=1 Tax=Nosema granulosis TaxID=83296 RepID=A0A9P6GWM9_9MICR|nr:hypothetical protein NGRA_2659 [Nosema granulosis]